MEHLYSIQIIRKEREEYQWCKENNNFEFKLGADNDDAYDKKFFTNGADLILRSCKTPYFLNV